ncbi:MAG: ATP-binding protein [Actinomycetota bacterium]|nr:ATP-binding protein [Actinomycetota bacterium]
MRLPIRVRLTVAFVAGMALVLVAVGVFVYVRMGAALLETNDAGLRSRAEVLVANVRASGPQLPGIGASLIESDEAFAQIADASGRITQSSPIVAASPLLSPGTITSLKGTAFFDRRIPGIDNVTRILAVPVGAGDGRAVVMVGGSLQDRRDHLLQLAATLAVGGPIALLVISWGGWLLAGAALRPMERMRRQAAAISTSDPGRRLPVPGRDDEVARLGVTLNEMLDRIQGSFDRERRLLNNAAHELRTPLAILKGEIDLARERERSAVELTATLESVSEETDHIVALAKDLLVLARMNGGAPALVLVETSLSDLVGRSSDRHRARAVARGVQLDVEACSITASVDPVRLRQAIDNLIDNALRYAPRDGHVRVVADRTDGAIRIVVEDSGRGLPDEFLARAFEPFARVRSQAEDEGAGLGLAIVRAIAEGHGGSAIAENRPEGGARITLMLPIASPA